MCMLAVCGRHNIKRVVNVGYTMRAHTESSHACTDDMGLPSEAHTIDTRHHHSAKTTRPTASQVWAALLIVNNHHMIDMFQKAMQRHESGRRGHKGVVVITDGWFSLTIVVAPVASFGLQ